MILGSNAMAVAAAEAKRKLLGEGDELAPPPQYSPEAEGAYPPGYNVEELPDQPPAQQAQNLPLPSSSFGQDTRPRRVGLAPAPELEIEDRSSRPRTAAVRAPYERAVQAVGGEQYPHRTVGQFFRDLGVGALKSALGGGSPILGAAAGAAGYLRQDERDRKIAEQAARYQAQDAFERQKSQDALTVEQRKSEIERRAEQSRQGQARIVLQGQKQKALEEFYKNIDARKDQANKIADRVERGRNLRLIHKELEDQLKTISPVTDPEGYAAMAKIVKQKQNEIEQLLDVPETSTSPQGRPPQVQVKQEAGGGLVSVAPGAHGAASAAPIVKQGTNQQVQGMQRKGGGGSKQPKSNRIGYEGSRYSRRAFIKDAKTGAKMYEGDPRMSPSDAALLKADIEAQKAAKAARGGALFGGK